MMQLPTRQLASVVTIGTNTEANWKTRNHAGKTEQNQPELLLTPRGYGSVEIPAYARCYASTQEQRGKRPPPAILGAFK